MTSSTLQDAAESAGVTTRSIYNWLREDAAFRTAYQDMRASSLQAVADKTAANVLEAVDTLSAIMRDKEERAGARITAARVLIENYVRLSELIDFEARLTAIEEQIAK